MPHETRETGGLSCLILTMVADAGMGGVQRGGQWKFCCLGLWVWGGEGIVTSVIMVIMEAKERKRWGR